MDDVWFPDGSVVIDGCRDDDCALDSGLSRSKWILGGGGRHVASSLRARVSYFVYDRLQTRETRQRVRKHVRAWGERLQEIDRNSKHRLFAIGKGNVAWNKKTAEGLDAIVKSGD